MLARLQVSAGRGRATLNLDVSGEGRPSARRRLGRLTLALVLPIVVVLGVQGWLTGWHGVDRLMNGRGAPWVWVLTAATIGLLMVLAIVLVARLRIVAERSDGVRAVTVTLLLTTVEALSLGIALGFLTIFVVHLLADGIACARGVSRAC